MADITLTYTPANGVVFSPTGWNTDIWSTTNGQSVVGEVNGHIEAANFAPGETVQPHHVRPFEAFRAESDGATETIDVVDRLFGTSFNGSAFLVIPGCSRRVYVPYPSACIFNVSFFGSNLRMREGPASGGVAVWSGPEIYLQLFINGVAVSGTQRKLPYTYYPRINPGNALFADGNEAMLTHHFDFSWLDPAGAGETYYDVSLRAQVLLNKGSEELYPIYDTDPAAVCTHEVMHRIRFGIRSAQVVMLASI